MRKRLYDFSIATGVIVILAYAFLFVFAIFMLKNNEGVLWKEYAFLGVVGASFAGLVIYYGFLPVTLYQDEVRHLSTKISRSDLLIYIRHNYRLRYDEIVFRPKSIDFQNLSRQQIKKNEIVIQYFIKTKFILEEYLSQKIETEENEWNVKKS